MPRSYASSVIGADPDTVWDFLRDFNRTPDFIDAVTGSEILGGKSADQVGCERRLTLDDGSLVRERLVALSDLDRSYTYHLLEDRFEARLVDAHHVEHVPGRPRTDRLDGVQLCTVAERRLLRRLSVREWPEPITA